MPGPPRTVSEAERKIKRALQARNRRSRTVNLGKAINDWNVIKEQEKCNRDEDMAQILINIYKANECRREMLRASSPGIPPSDDLSTIRTGSPIMSDRDVMNTMYRHYNTMDNVIIKREPADTYSEDDDNMYSDDDDQRNHPTHSENPDLASTPSSPTAEPREPEGLLMDESEHDIGSDGNYESRFVRNIQPKKNINSDLVDFIFIRGLPVNKPFRIRSSNYIVGSVESKVYIILERFEVSVPPIMINVKGVQEMPSEKINSNVLQAHRKSRHVAVPNKGRLNDSSPGHSYDCRTETGESDTKSAESEKMDEKTHIVSDILDEIIGAVVKQYKIHPDYGCEQSTEGGENKMSKKRKGSRDFMSFKKKHKVIKLDSTDNNVSHSSRIHSKGYRINYADLNELNSASDSSDFEESLTANREIKDTLEGTGNKPLTIKTKVQVEKNT